MRRKAVTIRELETNIRHFINHPRRQFPLLQNPPAWNTLTSSLDVIGDTELAITAYLSHPSPRTEGKCYLMIYGILQVLFVQQDAIENLVEAFELPYNADSDLKDIREIRNKTVGHPTKREGKKSKGIGQTSHFLSRSTMSKEGYELITTHANGRVEFTRVNLPTLIKKQRQVVQRVLKDTLTSLQQKEVAHRSSFKTERLADYFSTTQYMITKVDEACDRGSHLPFGIAALPQIRQHVEKFKLALEKRGELEGFSHLKYRFDEIEYALKQLEDYLHGVGSTLDERSARVFTFSLSQRVKQMQTLAQEIDEEYSHPV